MSNPVHHLPIGHLIGERYRIQSLIGRGGMGMVYSAVHELTGRRVALKLVVSDAEESPLLKERFLTEARIAAAVVHPNIVDVLDMGVHDGMLFLVMELLEGMSLERMLETEQRISPEQALAWVFPIFGALATLHDAGIVHRDVKPSNIFLSSLPRHPVRPKLLDFGLARVVSDLRLTRSGSVIGTPLYMAPEHAAGHDVGPQADVWSMGVVLFECLAGASPFSYTDRSSLAAQVLAGVTRPLSELRPDLPVVLSTVISRALQRDLARRYPDMRAFAYALFAAAATSGIALPRDPDPIGLPDYPRWAADGGAAVTAEHTSGSGPSAVSSSGESSRRLASLFGTVDVSASAPSKTARTGLGARARPLAIAAFIVLVGAVVYAIWPSASERPEAAKPSAPAAAASEATAPESPLTPKDEAAPDPHPQPTVDSEKVDDASAPPAKAAMDAPAHREPGSTRRRPAARRSKPVKEPSGAEIRRSESVDEVESEWK